VLEPFGVTTMKHLANEANEGRCPGLSSPQLQRLLDAAAANPLPSPSNYRCPIAIVQAHFLIREERWHQAQIAAERALALCAVGGRQSLHSALAKLIHAAYQEDALQWLTEMLNSSQDLQNIPILSKRIEDMINSGRADD
jgi:hypothetical protein